MKKLTIQTGSWKGKKITAPSDVSGHSHFTNSLVKKALFSLLEARLRELNCDWSEVLFLDFFSGSGQIAAEALSLGAKRALLFELDTSRFGTLIQTFSGEKRVTLFRKDSTRFPTKWELDQEKFIILFLDPPYTYWSETPDRMKHMLQSLYSYLEGLNLPFCIFSQIPSNQKTEKIWEALSFQVREYGSHSLVEVSRGIGFD